MSSLLRATLPLPLLVAAVLAAEPVAGLPKTSPFLSPAAAAATAPANENIEFAGVSSMGKKTDLILHDKTLKKSHWIGIGETKEGISVLTYDARLELAVVKVNGVEKRLPLRKGSGTASSGGIVIAPATGFNQPAPNGIAPAAVPAPAVAIQAPPPAAPPAAPAAPNTPETVARQETEARMLVSDLLEIGMAQRKAYEDAQRKAAEANPTPAPATPVKPDGS